MEFQIYRVSFTKIKRVKFSLTKLKAAFGNSESMEKLQVDTYTEDIINDVEGIPFALSNMNVMYAGLSELAGYNYFKTITIGTLQLKTFQGAILNINGTDFKLKLKSDMEELESEPTSISKRNVTRIDFEIDAEDVSKISRATIESLELIAKKTTVKFSIVEGSDEDLIEKHLTDEEPKSNGGQSEEEE